MSLLQRMGLAAALAATGAFWHAPSVHADDEATPPNGEATPGATPTLDPSWYTGGTLHKATVRQWLEATMQNQMATASDWVMTSKDMKAKASAGDMSVVVQRADKLRQCINAALRHHAQLYASMPASDLATTCMITLKY
jgi:hypothetical protein